MSRIRLIIFLVFTLSICVECKNNQKQLFTANVDYNALPYTNDKTTNVGDLYLYNLWGQVKSFTQTITVDGEPFRHNSVSFDSNGRQIIKTSSYFSEHKKSVSSDGRIETYSNGGDRRRGEDDILTKEYVDGYLVCCHHKPVQEWPITWSFEYEKIPTPRLKRIIRLDWGLILDNQAPDTINVKYAYGKYPIFTNNNEEESNYNSYNEFRIETLYTSLLFFDEAFEVDYLGLQDGFIIKNSDEKGNWTEIIAKSKEDKEISITRTISYYPESKVVKTGSDNAAEFLKSTLFENYLNKVISQKRRFEQPQTTNVDSNEKYKSLFEGRHYSRQVQESNGVAYRHTYYFYRNGEGEQAYYEVNIGGLDEIVRGWIEWDIIDGALFIKDVNGGQFFTIKQDFFSTTITNEKGQSYSKD